jgi:hypothetical protein
MVRLGSKTNLETNISLIDRPNVSRENSCRLLAACCRWRLSVDTMMNDMQLVGGRRLICITLSIIDNRVVHVNVDRKKPLPPPSTGPRSMVSSPIHILRFSSQGLFGGTLSHGPYSPSKASPCLPFPSPFKHPLSPQLITPQLKQNFGIFSY